MSEAHYRARRRAVWCIAFAAWALASPVPPAASQEGGSPFSGPARTALASSSVEVPLTKAGAFYFADVRMNGRPFRFTVETGAGFFGISARAAQALGLRVDSVEVTPGYRAPVAVVDSLTVSGATFQTLTARVVPAFDDAGFDGIISIPVLRQVLATLDLGSSRLVLERGSLPAPNGRDVFAFAGLDRGRRVDFEMSLGGVTVPAVLDTRSYIPLVVPDSLESALRLNSAPRFVGNAMGPSLGTFTLRGARLAADLRFGSFGVQRPAILFRNRPGVVVGVPFMEQFAITIDQQARRIRFARREPGALAVIPPQDWETTQAPAAGARGPAPRVAGATPTARPMGFNLMGAPGGELAVTNLVPGSTAERAGIRNGDRVVEFDGTPVAAMSPAIFRAAVAKGTPVKVVVQREGGRVEFMIQPQPAQ